MDCHRSTPFVVIRETDNPEKEFSFTLVVVIRETMQTVGLNTKQLKKLFHVKRQ